MTSILIFCIFVIWKGNYLISATQLLLQRRIPRPKQHEIKSTNSKIQQTSVVILSELLSAGFDPLSAVKSAIQIVPLTQQSKYFNLLDESGLESSSDFLSQSIKLVLKSSTSGSKIAESLLTNLQTWQRTQKNQVMQEIKKAEVWLLGPLGLCFLPTFMLIAVVPLIGSLISGFMA